MIPIETAAPRTQRWPLVALGLVGVLGWAILAAGLLRGMALPITAIWLAVASGLVQRGAAALAGAHPRRTPRSVAVVSILIGLVAGSGGPGSWVGWETLVLTAAGVVGAIVGNWTQVGLWENNQPPSGEILALLRDAHRGLPAERIRGWLPKRLFDLGMAAAGSVLAAPWAGLIAAAIWWQDPGPVLFVKNSTTTGGRNFRQWKFRTMIRDAEQETGPILAAQADRRVLPFGRFLRKTALDELPQLLNVLLGEMSIVGPRPQRTILVAGYVADLPDYPERHSVPPGLAGLAQAAGDYYLTPRQKLRYDLLYIRHASLAFDLRLLAAALVLVFWYRWKPGWNGRLPRRWIRPSSPANRTRP